MIVSLVIEVHMYHKTSNISRTLLAIKILITQIFILDLIPGFNGLGKDNCKTRRETFGIWCGLY